MHEIQVVDSHTGGEPTRVIVSGGPDLGDGPLSDRVVRFRSEFDRFRSAIVNEPRGSDTVVGALLCKPHAPDCAAGVIFFNNVDYLGMCGHGTIGLLVTLAHLGHIIPGQHNIDTPVGVVTAELIDANQVRCRNVASFRWRKQVPLEVPGFGILHGDIAYGGNWFFLVEDHGQLINMRHLDVLRDCSVAIRRALERQGITGDHGEKIDHIELFGPSSKADSRSYVLCPGLAYDRSPCGTGTSAKLACLAADGKLKSGTTWRQESVVGSIFEAEFEWAAETAASDGGEPLIIPTLVGSAWVNGENRQLIDPTDPFGWGIP